MGSKDARRRSKTLKAIDGDVCHYCGEELTDSTRSFDHVVPLAEGGRHALANLVLSCIDCNGRRGMKNYTKFSKGKIWEQTVL